MVFVNYIEENIRFIEYASMNRVSGNERLIWYALLHIINRHANGALWPDQFIAIPNRVLLTYAPVSEDTLIRARNQLVQHGLIEYKPGKKRSADPEYRLCYFTAQPADDVLQPGFYPQRAGKSAGKGAVNSADNPSGKSADIRINIDYNGGINDAFIPLGEDERETGEDAGTRSLRKRVQARLHEDFTGKDYDESVIETLTEKRRRFQKSYQASRQEQRMYMIMLDALRYEPVKSLYQGHERLYRELVESAEYPLELVDMAVQQTEDRARRSPLGSPVAYTVRLLRDWRERDIRSVRELNAALQGTPPPGPLQEGQGPSGLPFGRCGGDSPARCSAPAAEGD